MLEIYAIPTPHFFNRYNFNNSAITYFISGRHLLAAREKKPALRTLIRSWILFLKNPINFSCLTSRRTQSRHQSTQVGQRPRLERSVL